MLPEHSLSSKESERLRLATSLCRLQKNQYIPHKPTPKQLAFLLLNNQEAFYGGAAGGGKSDALLMAALQYVDYPGYAAIIFRKNYSELNLPGALMDRAREWLSSFPAINWKEQEKTWHFPSGATLSFGYLDTDGDKYRYQSAEFQYIGFDELTEFNEDPFRFLFSRLRRLQTSDIPLRMRAASNPGGIGHDWVKQRFITEGLEKGRVFIPATLDDNPFLDRTSYVESLNKLDPITRQRLLLGDWTARDAGNLFKREWFKLVDVAPEGCQWIRYWDMAATEAKHGTDPDWTSGCRLGRKGNSFYLSDMRHLRATPQNVEAVVKQCAQLDGTATRIFIEQEPGASGKSLVDYYVRVVLLGYALRGDKVTGDKITRAQPVSSQAEAGNIYLVNGAWISTFLDEAEAFPNGAHDDQVDALSGAFAQLTKSGTAEIRWI